MTFVNGFPIMGGGCFFYLLDYCTNLTRVDKLGTRNGTHKQTQERLKERKAKKKTTEEGGREHIVAMKKKR